jgi:hypothetical protein
MLPGIEVLQIAKLGELIVFHSGAYHPALLSHSAQSGRSISCIFFTNSLDSSFRLKHSSHYPINTADGDTDHNADRWRLDADHGSHPI